MTTTMTKELKEIAKGELNTPEKVAALGRAILNAEPEHDRDKEHFWVVGLNTKHNIKYIDLVSLGTLNRGLVHPREVFRYSIMQGVASIIVMHNHPSNDTAPSPEDREMTKRLVEAGKILCIEVLDSVIVTQDGYMSFKQKGILGGLEIRGL